LNVVFIYNCFFCFREMLSRIVQRHPRLLRHQPVVQNVLLNKDFQHKKHEYENFGQRFYSSASGRGKSGQLMKYGAAALGFAISGSLLKLYLDQQSSAMCDSKSGKIFSREEVSKMKSKQDGGIWVIYKNNVYNITDFVDNHPGGSSKIMLAAGDNLEPYWDMYAIHKKNEVLDILSEYHIGKLRKIDWATEKKTEGPFANDPKRHPALLANSKEPYNGETPTVLATDTLITPNELFFVRNHLPVPDLKATECKLKVEGDKQCISLNLDDLKTKFKKVELISAIQCAGNRRSEMNKIKKVKGLSWSHNAISNAKWSGVLLKDLLLAAGVDPEDKSIKHVHFEGADKGPSGAPYGASIPINRIFQKNLPILVAYEMNGEPLPRDHGFPLRIVAPGIVGARNVKWLQRIAVSPDEYQGHWQQNDYKPFSSNVDWDTVDFSKSVAIQELPVTSAICVPTDGSVVHESEEEFIVKGYAYSGGGNGILRVDVSIDGGKSWLTADLMHSDQEIDDMYSWTLWQCTVPIPENHSGKMSVMCRAVDTSCNTQPDTVAPVWNLRGCLNNSWHNVEVVIDSNDE